MKTKDEVLTLNEDDTYTLSWYRDTVFVVYHDVKSRIGSVCILRKGFINGDSTR